ncbi:phosphoribosyltransferase-like protein [Chytridium lagenaria]|nr:phosphoribosyltransferase-like protein [Chytridium lagenaria]
MKEYQRDFLSFAISQNVLSFGSFTLKSGRTSPYFFNADRIRCSLWTAYKGIPLVSATSIALSRDLGRDVPYSFNRKEKKDHGEGGSIVGSSLKGKRVVVVDDVITAGRRSGNVLISSRRRGGARGNPDLVESTGERWSIVSLKDLVEFLREKGQEEDVKAITKYWEEFGVDSI